MPYACISADKGRRVVMILEDTSSYLQCCVVLIGVAGRSHVVTAVAAGEREMASLTTAAEKEGRS